MGLRRFDDPVAVAAIFAPRLEEGEHIRHLAYGVRMPPMIVALLLAMVAGAGGLNNVTKHYLVALTDRRFIVLRVGAQENDVEDMQAWLLAALPPVTAPPAGTRIAIADPDKPFKAKFKRLGMPGQADELRAIAAALAGAKAAA